MSIKIKKLKCRVKVKLAEQQGTKGQSNQSAKSPSMQYLLPPPSLSVGESSTEGDSQAAQTQPVAAPSLESVNVQMLTDRISDMIKAEARMNRDRSGIYRES